MAKKSLTPQQFWCWQIFNYLTSPDHHPAFQASDLEMEGKSQWEHPSFALCVHDPDQEQEEGFSAMVLWYRWVFGPNSIKLMIAHLLIQELHYEDMEDPERLGVSIVEGNGYEPWPWAVEGGPEGYAGVV